MGQQEQEVHPRDRFITVFGRKPVLEALTDPRVEVHKVVLARGSRGEALSAIVDAARQRNVPVHYLAPKAVTRLSRNGSQDQGAVADIEARRMQPLEQFLQQQHMPGTRQPPAVLMLLDGVTTPANVGMVLRSATAAGITGVVLPRMGCPEVGPLVIKASAGVALHAPILRCQTAAAALTALVDAGFTPVGLGVEAAQNLYTVEEIPARLVLVLGNETDGMSPAVAQQVHWRWAVPMAAGVESLNVAVAAAVVAFEVQRRRSLAAPPAGVSSGGTAWT